MATNAEKSAELLLDSVWQLGKFPVDPVWIARQLGIDVIETKLPDEVSGAIVKDIGKDPIIALCHTDSNNRKRFTCAHELGHYAFRVDNNQDEYEYVDLRNRDSSNGTDPEEIFANQFAACLLMPEEEVRRKHKEKIPSFIMAQHFGVSGEWLGKKQIPPRVKPKQSIL